MSHLIQIKTTPTAVLSKLQKQFNISIKKIDALKKELHQTTNEIDKIQVKLASDVMPLEHKMLKIHVQEIKYLDQLYQENVLKKRDNETLSSIIHERSFELIEILNDEELKAIFERHNDGKSFEEVDSEAEGATSELMKEMMSKMFGIEFEEDADVSTPEKMQEYIDQKMEQQNTEEQTKRASRKKTDKQLEREEKRKQEEKNLNKTSRQIYMELVKEFHPDREKDATERERKTLLMHRITAAYEKDDLFELLRLRLELLGTDFEHSSDEQLKYYVKLLKQQVAELEEELYVMQSFGQTSPFAPSLYERFCTDKFQTMESKFKKVIANLKKEIKTAEQNLPAYQDITQVKYMIQNYRK